MMRAVNITANPPTQRTPDNDVRKVMLVPRKPRDAHRARNSIRRDLHRGSILVLVRDDSRDGPRLCAVSRRKRAAAIKKFTALAAIQRTRALRDALQNTLDNDAVDYRFRTQQSRFSRPIILLRPADYIKHTRHRGQTVNRTEITDMPAPRDLALSLADLVAGDPVCGEQRHQTDAGRNRPLRVAPFEM